MSSCAQHGVSGALGPWESARGGDNVTQGRGRALAVPAGVPGRGGGDVAEPGGGGSVR